MTVIQAPVGWSFLAWVAYVPFALACAPQVRARTVALAAFGVGYLYWLGSVYWITPITIIGWLGMGLYLSVFWVLPALAVRFSRAKGIPLFIALPILVVGWERMQGFPMGGFFWRFLGHSQYENLAMIQIADLVGAAGVSLVVAIVNGLLADLILFAGRRKPCRVGLAPPEPARHKEPVRQAPPYSPRRSSGSVIVVGTTVAIVAVTGTILYGQWRLGQAEDSVSQGPLVASLQSNVPISVKRSFKAGQEIFDELMTKSQAAASAGAELIIWPETMVQGYLQPELWPQLAGADLAEDMAFHEALGRHAKGTAYVLVGAYGGEVMRDPLGKDYLGKYNSAYLYRPDGTRDPGRYDKIHLVLFGEYIPFRRHIPWLFEQLKRFLPEGYNPDYSLEHGKRYTIFEMNDSTKGQRTDDIGQRPAGGLARSGPVRASGGPAAPGWESNTAEGGGATSGVTTNALDAATPTDPQSAIRNHVTPDLDPGPQSPQAPPYRFAVIICYEDTIPYVARNFTLDKQGRKRIDWLVNISNDGWFVRFVKDPPEVIPSTELPQHAAICVFRAVENRLAVVRSVNTGISCLIESTGRIRDGYMAAGDGFPAGVMERTAMAGWFLDRLPIDKRVTFYSRHGEWLANGCAAVFVATLAWPLGGRFVRRRTREQTKANG